MKDNLPMLEVKALGGFSMRYGEKTISIGSGKSTKAVKLLQILVCSEGRTVSRERLLDMLYEMCIRDRDSTVLNLLSMMDRQQPMASRISAMC